MAHIKYGISNGFRNYIYIYLYIYISGVVDPISDTITRYPLSLGLGIPSYSKFDFLLR
ncbi:hypothetical protein IC582_012390 [Cucumis melo]